jgi:hypothetical protein
MLHRLTVGHLDPVAVQRRQVVPTKALEMDAVNRLLAELGEVDADGSITLGGRKVDFMNVAISCLWMGGGINCVAEEFALRLQRKTGCLIADVCGYRIVQPEDLVGLTAYADTSTSVTRSR